MNFNFPRTKFVDENGLVGQLLHMKSEQLEAEESMLTPDINHTAEEIMDKYHSCETGLRILHEKYGVNLDQLRDLVEQKNTERGYYEQGDNYGPSTSDGRREVFRELSILSKTEQAGDTQRD